MDSHLTSLALTALIGFASPEVLAETPRRVTHNWNQWNDQGTDGLAESMTLLAIGARFAPAGGRNMWIVQGSFEYMLLDRWGLEGRGGVSVASEGGTFVPLSLGLNLHLLPKRPFDPYLGGGGGFTYVRMSGHGGALVPTLNVGGGLDFCYWGLFFLQAAGGYTFLEYAGPDFYVDLRSWNASLGTGMYF
ncbi:MAG: hypothetical protein WCI05_11745 [Myxococcales bacterium]